MLEVHVRMVAHLLLAGMVMTRMLCQLAVAVLVPVAVECERVQRRNQVIDAAGEAAG